MKRCQNYSAQMGIMGSALAFLNLLSEMTRVDTRANAPKQRPANLMSRRMPMGSADGCCLRQQSVMKQLKLHIDIKSRRKLQRRRLLRRARYPKALLRKRHDFSGPYLYLFCREQVQRVCRTLVIWIQLATASRLSGQGLHLKTRSNKARQHVFPVLFLFLRGEPLPQ